LDKLTSKKDAKLLPSLLPFKQECHPQENAAVLL